MESIQARSCVNLFVNHVPQGAVAESLCSRSSSSFLYSLLSYADYLAEVVVAEAVDGVESARTSCFGAFCSADAAEVGAEEAGEAAADRVGAVEILAAAAASVDSAEAATSAEAARVIVGRSDA
jgi:hypothetical protein